PKSLAKEDGSNAEVGEQLDFKVMEFSKEDRKIILSHTNVYSDPKEDPSAKADKFTKKKAVAGEKKEPKADKKVKEVEKSTLGDLDALSALKDKMMSNEKEAGVQKLEAAAKAKKDASNEETASEETEG